MSINTPPHTLVIFGTFIDAPTPYELRLKRRHVCQVDTHQGKIVRLEPEENVDLKEIPSGLGVDTLRLSETQAVAVGLIDCVRNTYDLNTYFVPDLTNTVQHIQ